jgi:hypothetical protein
MHRYRAGLLGIMSALVGCYSYTPVRPEVVPLGEVVRVRMTTDEAQKFADLQLRDSRLLEGRLQNVSDDAVTVEATIGANDPQRGMRALMQRVDVSNAGMVELEWRRLDRARTGFLIAGGTAVLTAVVVGQFQGGGGDEDGPGGGSNEAVWIPFLRIGLPF